MSLSMSVLDLLSVLVACGAGVPAVAIAAIFAATSDDPETGDVIVSGAPSVCGSDAQVDRAGRGPVGGRPRFGGALFALAAVRPARKPLGPALVVRGSMPP